jgi:hypothetical protein
MSTTSPSVRLPATAEPKPGPPYRSSAGANEPPDPPVPPEQSDTRQQELDMLNEGCPNLDAD